MLDKEGRDTIRKIKKAADYIWNENYKRHNKLRRHLFVSLIVYICIYQVQVSYDRSIIDIAVEIININI